MLRYAAIALATAAWLLRPFVLGEQFAQGAVVGSLFLLVSFAQAAFGLAVALRPWMVDATGGRRIDPAAFATGRTVYLAGAAGNALVLALDALTRLTVARPDTGMPAPIPFTVPAGMVMAVELALSLALLRLARADDR